MTKYILVGGYVQKGARGGQDFCDAFVKDLPRDSQVLICPFARPEDAWQNSFEERRNFFLKFIDREDLSYENAQPEIFSKQCRESSAIFFMGGDSEARLMKYATKDTSWMSKKVLENKTLAGTSAGAYALSRYYYDITDYTIKSGLGLAKVKSIVHCFSAEYSNVNWQQAHEALVHYKEQLPVWCLKEGEFKILEA